MLYTDIYAHFNEGWPRLPLGGRSALELVVYLVFSVLAWGLFRAVYLLYFHPLASFPGPYQAALSTWWLYALSKSGQTEEVLEHMHKKYSIYHQWSPLQNVDIVDRHTRTKNRPKRATHYQSCTLSYDILATLHIQKATVFLRCF